MSNETPLPSLPLPPDDLPFARFAPEPPIPSARLAPPGTPGSHALPPNTASPATPYPPATPATPLPPGSPAPPQVPFNPKSKIENPKSEVPWYHHTWLLFLVLFGASAATGLHWLWRTPKLSRESKWLWTVVISAYTIAILVAFGWVMLWCWRQFLALPRFH